MQRRNFTSLTLLCLLCALPLQPAWALQLSDQDAATGIRTALERGVGSAIGILGKNDGFLGNPQVRIPMPGFLKDASKILKATGQQKRVDALELAMNRAAEAAVPQAKTIMVGAVKNLSVQDAVQLVQGGEGAVTRFFADKTREPLSVSFLPIVTRATEKVALAEKYNQVAGKAVGLGLVKKQDANMERYVTAKALDGLYLMIAQEEQKIRQDPVGTGSAILKTVFGSLK
jgi:Protein of unknown function (DUF4197)